MSEKTKMTRRRFLLLAGGTIGATALACGGLVISARPPEVKFIEESFGDRTNMKDKILVAYASKRGSTGEVARAIGQTLANNGATVDVRQTKDVSDLSTYRAVVLGCAIRQGKWLPEAVKFVEAHQPALSRVPIAYFTDGLWSAWLCRAPDDRKSDASTTGRLSQLDSHPDLGADPSSATLTAEQLARCGGAVLTLIPCPSP